MLILSKGGGGRAVPIDAVPFFSKTSKTQNVVVILLE